MNHAEKTISFISEMKDNIRNNKYSSSAELENDFYSISRLTADYENDLRISNLSTLCKVHEFLIDEVCKIHDAEEGNRNCRLFSSALNVKELRPNLNDGKKAFNMYSFTNCDFNYYFIGDLHSDTISLKRILHKSNFFDAIVKGEQIRLVFLGDYVDRGHAHLKILGQMLALKHLFPDNIYLLRGNHDGGSICNDQVKLCVGRNKDTVDRDYFLLHAQGLAKENETFHMEMLTRYLKFFNSLCNAAFICHEDVSIFAVHAGIPRPRTGGSKCFDYISSISDLTNDCIVDSLNKTMKYNMFWSDPLNGQDDLRENSGRFRFTAKQYEEFKKTIGFDLLVRGHQAEKDGYKRHFNGDFLTVFSSGAILENNKNMNNETAYPDICPKILNFNEKGELSIIDLNGPVSGKF